MKRTYFLLIPFTVSLPLMASEIPDKDLYYGGTEIRTSLFSKPQVFEEIIVKKSLLPSKNMIVEMACIKAENRPAYTSPVYMFVKGNNLRISDKEFGDSVALTGKGKVEGTDWDWNYLSFSMRYQLPNGFMRIEDENWISGKYLVAIKELFWNGSDGTPEIKTDIVTAKIQEISQSAFEAKYKELGCP